MRFKYILADSAQLFQVLASAIIVHNQKIALVQLGGSTGHGRWCLPFVAANRHTIPLEQLEHMVQRQLQLQTTTQAVVNTVVELEKRQSYGLINFVYAMAYTSGELPTSTDDWLSVAWFSYNQLFRMPKESLLYPHIRTVVKAYRKGQRFDLTSVRPIVL